MESVEAVEGFTLEAHGGSWRFLGFSERSDRIPGMYRTVLGVFFLASVLVAQGGGQATALEEFAAKLKLDAKTQIPAVETIFTDAARAAVPASQALTKARQQILEAQLSGKAEDLATANAAYAAAAAKMTAIETEAYGRVFAILKPNQQTKTKDAFPLMAGLFMTQARAPRTGRTGGGQ